MPGRDDMRPAFRTVMVTSLFFAATAALLIVMFSGYTPQFAAARAIIIAGAAADRRRPGLQPRADARTAHAGGGSPAGRSR